DAGGLRRKVRSTQAESEHEPAQQCRDELRSASYDVEHAAGPALAGPAEPLQRDGDTHPGIIPPAVWSTGSGRADGPIPTATGGSNPPTAAIAATTTP